jgi:dTDP-4-dehydrorhamnose reductase
MKLQDIVRATADSIQFERIVSKMKLGVETKITGDVPKVVELASKSYGLLEKESQGVLDHLIRGEELSLYGLANAVTRHAQDVVSYDRSTELEMTAWSILSMPRNEWAKMNAAA